ncbi:MAG: SAM-dependent methyltransferase [Deltaproteobacteria bacterium]|nr:SAM-dependent methyltransferase [Deltaproteobacteria bacterium]
MRLLSWLIFVPLQILWIPVSLVGVVLVAWKQSWTMHLFGMREDEATHRLAKVLPNTSTAGLFLTLFPLWVKWKIAGELAIYPRDPVPGAESIAELVTARTARFDGIIDRVLGDVEQFVVMGAGYDTRAFGSFRRDGLTFFELDQEAVQAHKRSMLAEAGVDASSVRFVGVDFSKDDVFARLAEAGFDPTRKTIFLWEGVTLYLSEESVRRTMQQVRENSPGGSVLLADLYGDRLVDMMKSRAGAAALAWTDEGAGFGLPLAEDWEGRLAAFVQSESLRVGEAWFLGSSSEKGPFAVVVEMIV